MLMRKIKKAAHPDNVTLRKESIIVAIGCICRRIYLL